MRDKKEIGVDIVLPLEIHLFLTFNMFCVALGEPSARNAIFVSPQENSPMLKLLVTRAMPRVTLGVAPQRITPSGEATVPLVTGFPLGIEVYQFQLAII